MAAQKSGMSDRSSAAQVKEIDLRVLVKNLDQISSIGKGMALVATQVIRLLRWELRPWSFFAFVLFEAMCFWPAMLSSTIMVSISLLFFYHYTRRDSSNVIGFDAIRSASVAAMKKPPSDSKSEEKDLLSKYFTYVCLAIEISDMILRGVGLLKRIVKFEEARLAWRLLGLAFGIFLIWTFFASPYGNMALVVLAFSVKQLETLFCLEILDEDGDGVCASSLLPTPRSLDSSSSLRSNKELSEWVLLKDAKTDSTTLDKGDEFTPLEEEEDDEEVRMRDLRSRPVNPHCAQCDGAFGLFKKRTYCRSCGDSFCKSCCSYKVPRSVFGATAPAAQQETVRVCRQCHRYLTSHENIDSLTTHRYRDQNSIDFD